MYGNTSSQTMFFWKLLKIFTLISVFCFLISTLFISCKKTNSPKVNVVFLEPTPNSNSKFDDTLLVKGSITSDQIIQSAILQLTDNNFTPLCPAVSLPASGMSMFSFANNYILSNNYSPSGNYQLNVVVQCENQTFNFYHPIFVTELPRTTKKILVASGSASNYQLSILNGSVLSILTSEAISYVNLKANSRSQDIYMCANEKIIAISAENLVPKFTILPLAINANSFLNVDFSDNNLRVCRNDGNLISYNQFGSKQNETGENLFLQPLQSFVYQNYQYAEIIKNSEHKIATFFYPSGAARQEYLIDFDIIAFYPISSTEILVLGNKSDHLLIYKYLTLSNGLQLLKDIPQSFLYSVIKENSSILLLSTIGILDYNVTTNSIINRSNGIFYGGNYDEVNDILYCFSGHNIKTLQGTSFAELTTTISPDSLMGVDILYSK